MLEYGFTTAILGVARGNRIGEADEGRHGRESGNQAEGDDRQLVHDESSEGCTKLIHLFAPVIFVTFY
jgi:hypothetical protein